MNLGITARRTLTLAAVGLALVVGGITRAGSAHAGAGSVATDSPVSIRFVERTPGKGPIGTTVWRFEIANDGPQEITDMWVTWWYDTASASSGEQASGLGGKELFRVLHAGEHLTYSVVCVPNAGEVCGSTRVEAWSNQVQLATGTDAEPLSCGVAPELADEP